MIVVGSKLVVALLALLQSAAQSVVGTVSLNRNKNVSQSCQLGVDEIQVAQDIRWNPKYMILVNLDRGSAKHILRDQVFSDIKNLVLVEADRFPSFEGNRFNLATWYLDQPYLYQSLTGPEGEGEGLSVEMLNAMSKIYNFTYDMTTVSPDEQWGMFENGSWNGMLGMIHTQDKHFTVNMFTYTRDRMRDFDASVSYWMEGFGMALMPPDPLPKWRNVYYPFSWQVWVCVGGSYVFAVAVYMVLQKIKVSTKQQQQQRQQQQQEVAEGVGVNKYKKGIMTGMGVNKKDIMTGMGVNKKDTMMGVGVNEYKKDLMTGVGVNKKDIMMGVGVNKYKKDLITGVGVNKKNTTTGMGVNKKNITTGMGVNKNDSMTGVDFSAWLQLLQPLLNEPLVDRIPPNNIQWHRVFLATWTLTCFILTSAYTANLIAVLSIPVYPKRIETIEELSNSDYR
ncbi:hypothetical protein Pcinc_042221 [Petrolisthes cinctipes]|uniref:Ionotropic glutamate receptor L-glutamate and glycine-binding domain-containing protein n=1 Tax=Petrolisthes cinctipes TaxID=88211 RepID=A0AAE1BLQ2_PETCI|nr:hypothetical protein Pcinc_042221 [Petrolisthes cinctipes]